MINISTIQTHIVHYSEGKYEHLLLKRSSKAKFYPGMWQVVTGKIEKNEKAFKAAYREAEEETNLEFNNFWHVPIIGSFYDIRSDSIQNIPIFAVQSKNKNVKLSLEHEDYSWLSFDDALNELSLPSHINGTIALKKYILDNNNKDFFRIYN